MVTELRRSRVQHVPEDSRKALIELLIPKIGPEVLRDVMKEYLEFWSEEMKKIHTVPPIDHAGGRQRDPSTNAGSKGKAKQSG